jgi:hypothetical protein
MTFEQWQYADYGIKPTDIWGYFNIPDKLIKIKPSGMSKKYPCGSSGFIGWPRSPEKRAMTPPGFAKAFFEANK